MFFSKDMSRLKKKLLIYFLLIAIVSISVSAEIILELSSSRFRHSIENNFFDSISSEVPENTMKKLKATIDHDAIFNPLFDFRNRMLLLLLVVSISIFSAFFLFTRDIVSPMDSMVEATKKIANGDLTVTVPKMSEDEIGQMAELINDMNFNLQDLIMQIKQEVTRHNEKLVKVNSKMAKILRDDITEKVLNNKKIKVSAFKNLIEMGKEIDYHLVTMEEDLHALLTFVNMFKTYKSKSQMEISENEIETAFDNIPEYKGKE